MNIEVIPELAVTMDKLKDLKQRYLAAKKTADSLLADYRSVSKRRDALVAALKSEDIP